MTLCAVCEDRNRRENVAHREFAAMKDRAGRDRKLAATFRRLAAPHFATGKTVEIGAATLRAVGFPGVIGEPDGLESLVSLVI
jgi:hypothetical protein